MSAEPNTHRPTAGWCPEIIGASPTVKWPVMPGPEGVKLLAGLCQLDQSQWLSPEAMLERQLGQMRLVLRQAWHTVPFYKDRFAKAGIDVTQPLTLDVWRRVPLLTRVDIQRVGKGLLSNRIPPDHGKISWTQTSGSTGEPVRVAKSALADYFWKLLTLRNHQWHRRDLSGKLAAIRFAFGKEGAPSPDGKRSRAWGSATSGIFRTGPACILHIGSNVSDQANWLQRENPDYLLTYPSNLFALTTYCRKHGIRLPKLREVQTVGEIVTPSMRFACRDVWGVPLVDMYSSQEFGYLALQCPDHEHLHVQSESVLVEVLDAAGNDCAPGQTGRLVISSLHNFATPLIRYEIGDHAEVGAPCDCGRGLSVLNRILGRSRNMVMLPNGEQRFPIVGFRQFREIAPIRQYQFIQKTLTQLIARFVVEQPVTAEQEQELKETVQQAIGHPFEMAFEYLDSIPRGKTGKYEEFMSEVK